MRNTWAVLLLCLLTAPPAIAQSSQIADLLRSVDIDPADVRTDIEDQTFMAGMPSSSPLGRRVMANPLDSDQLAGVIAELLAKATDDDPVQGLATLARFNGPLVRRGLLGDPAKPHLDAAQQTGALLDALREVGGGRLDRDQLNALPASLQQAATVLLLAMRDAQPPIRRALESAGDDRWWGQVERELRKPLPDAGNPAADEPDDDYKLRYKQTLQRFDTRLCQVAAQDLVFAVKAARRLLRDDPNLLDPNQVDPALNIRLATRFGWVILAGTGDQTHDPRGPVALIIDLGGNDTYAQAGANGDRDHPVSLALDLAGDDLYLSEGYEYGTFGCGMLGVGILWDEAGTDRYEAERHSQGVGVFGVGVLFDRAGDDYYAAVADSQAHGTAGYGLLIDAAGNDYYESYVASQAFARPNAAAALIDGGGHDRYIANDTDLRFPSPQNPQHNVSMCQGAAVGERADYLDGHSISGGAAILYDAAGNDEYSCGVFGQGTGYWCGVGMLIDDDGDDTYTGHWYVQGASAHFAAGLLFDRGGDDTYFARQNMSQGAGHDVGIGVLVDSAGDDTYRGSTLGLGASNAAGVGIFIDHAGDDQYAAPPSSCLGWANGNGAYRGLIPAYGLFFDLAGRDTYAGLADNQTTRPEPTNSAHWTTPPAAGRLFGHGFDGE